MTHRKPAVRWVAVLLAAALALPAVAQEKKPAKKPAAKPAVHTKPTPQQIRKFNDLEKKEEIRGRSLDSRANSKQQAVRAPSPEKKK